MGTGFHGGFGGGTQGAQNDSGTGKSKPRNKTDYNAAGSKSVGKVDSVTTTNNVHTVPEHGQPNSVSQNYKNGKLSSERYYDNNGNAYLDIDYTNHGNAKLHPHVPHEHKIHYDKDGNLIREHEPKGGLNK
ncbi:MAG: hypothetical protein IJR70_07390 [Eubacterium sp.]|nr:hypothetical protein [Eubacterium sp.]